MSRRTPAARARRWTIRKRSPRYGEAVFLLYRKLCFRKAKKIICPAERFRPLRHPRLAASSAGRASATMPGPSQLVRDCKRPWVQTNQSESKKTKTIVDGLCFLVGVFIRDMFVIEYTLMKHQERKRLARRLHPAPLIM